MVKTMKKYFDPKYSKTTKLEAHIEILGLTAIV
jgi:hypothetical protein